MANAVINHLIVLLVCLLKGFPLLCGHFSSYRCSTQMIVISNVPDTLTGLVRTLFFGFFLMPGPMSVEATSGLEGE